MTLSLFYDINICVFFDVNMNSKSDLIEMDGVVDSLLPNATFRVILDNGHILIAHTSGKMRKSRVRVLVGDRVLVQISPHDTRKGRVIRRYNPSSPSSINNPLQVPPGAVQS